MSIGVLGETQLAILSSFWSLTIRPLLLKVPSCIPHRVLLYEFFHLFLSVFHFDSFLFSSALFSSFSSFFFLFSSII